MLIAILGVGILLYPTAAAWFSDRVHATEISGYVDTVGELEPSAKKSILDAAKKFNQDLPSGPPLRDPPYSLNDEANRPPLGAGSDAYQNLLDVGGPGGMMGRISIPPSIHSDLPIFHGTDEDSLSKGAGHLFGSALPVGGEGGTHSVLSAHSGFVSATLFENLHKVAKGETFSISVLDQTIYYKVDSIQTVLPDQTDALRKVPGKDYVTLITCTPTGVNSHRLLVRGERTEAPPVPRARKQCLVKLQTQVSPWWVLGLIGAATAAILVTRPRDSAQVQRRERTTP